MRYLSRVFLGRVVSEKLPAYIWNGVYLRIWNTRSFHKNFASIFSDHTTSTGGWQKKGAQKNGLLGL